MRRIVAGRLDHEPGLDEHAQQQYGDQRDDYFQRPPVASAHLNQLRWELSVRDDSRAWCDRAVIF